MVYGRKKMHAQVNYTILSYFCYFCYFLDRILPIDILFSLINNAFRPFDVKCRYCINRYGPQWPICRGFCIEQGFFCFGYCRREPTSPARDCILHALEVSYKECETECQDHGTTCQKCITSTVPETCQAFVSFNVCASCSKPINEAHKGCKAHKDPLQCVIDSISKESPTCKPCIGSIGCKSLGPESDICTNSQNNSDLWIHSHSQANPKCRPGWIRSKDDSQYTCFKVFKLEDPLTWDQAATFCTNNGGQLAISDSKNKVNSITDSLGDTNAKESWISGKQPQSSPSTFKWLPINTNVNPLNWSVNGKCPNGKTNTCMYVDENGNWCNQDCDEKYNVVCQHMTKV